MFEGKAESPLTVWNIFGAYNIKHYGHIMHGFYSKLMCLSEQVEVKHNTTKALAYYGICPFTVYYDSVMFYSTRSLLDSLAKKVLLNMAERILL